MGCRIFMPTSLKTHIMKNNENKALSLEVTEGLKVTVIPDHQHVVLMTSKEVAYGYGTSEEALRQHKKVHSDELVEGKHYFVAVRFSHSAGIPLKALGVPHNATIWTQRGVVRLGFFVKSERAKLFRDWVEDITMEKLEIFYNIPKNENDGYIIYDFLAARAKFGFSITSGSVYSLRKKYKGHFVKIRERWYCTDNIVLKMHNRREGSNINQKLIETQPLLIAKPNNQLSLFAEGGEDA